MTKASEKTNDEVDDELDALIAQSAEEGAEIGEDEVEIDLTEAVSFKPFTAQVPVEIVKASLKRGKESQRQYIELQVRVFEGEHITRVLFTNITLTGKGAGFGFETLEAFGARSKDGELITEKNRRVYVAGLVGLKALASAAPDKRPEYDHKTVINKIKPYVSEAESEAENLK